MNSEESSNDSGCAIAVIIICLIGFGIYYFWDVIWELIKSIATALFAIAACIVVAGMAFGGAFGGRD